MKRSLLIISAVLAILICSCNKRMDVDAPSFSVSIDPARRAVDTFVYRLGDTTQFLFSGTAGNIAFYSGEPGRKYENRNRVLKQGATTLSFSSKAEWGTQTNTLQLLAISKLNVLDSTAVVNAAWKDITSRAALANSATVVNSGAIDLSDLVSGEKDSLYLAFKYTGVTGSTQRTWTITNYVVNNVLPDLSYTLSSLATDASYWTRYGNVWSPASARWTASATSLTLTGGTATAPSNTSWIISRPIYVGQISPDVSIGVKSITDPDKAGYAYKYTAPGIYKATFVAFNHTVAAEKSIVKELIIKVIP